MKQSALKLSSQKQKKYGLKIEKMNGYIKNWLKEKKYLVSVITHISKTIISYPELLSPHQWHSRQKNKLSHPRLLVSGHYRPTLSHSSH